MAQPTLFDQIARLPCWSSGVEISPLPGGMTNRNFLVADRDGKRFVVRVGRDLPDHGVMRFNELAAARAAHAAGISPEVIHAGEGMLVSRYIDGKTFAPKDVRDVGALGRVVGLIDRCHHDIPRYFRGPALIFWVFQVIRNYLSVLNEAGKNPLGLDLAELERRMQWLERRVGPVEIVFGHNDLLAANFIDDGARLWLIDWDYAGFNSPLFDLANLSSNNAFTLALDERLLAANFIDDGARLWLIDWDYAGFNSPLFDLANLSSNNAFTPALDEQLLAAYFANGIDSNCRRGFAAMKCASLLRELLWGATSLVSSTIEFNYAAYTRDYLQRFEAMWLATNEGD